MFKQLIQVMNQNSKLINRVACVKRGAGLLVVVLVCFTFVFANNAIANQGKPDSKSTADAKDGEEEAKPEKPEEPFVPDFVDNDFDGSEERAWEYRPYLVAVWFCLDGSPALNSVYKEISADVTRRSLLIDPSGWDITTGLAPSKWRFRFSNHIDKPEKCSGIAKHPALEKYDKLMVVCLDSGTGLTQVRVREYDVQTQQWGPMVERKVSQKHQLGQNVIDAIRIAFMPIARIDRVQELAIDLPDGKKKKRDEVVMQVRAIRSCFRTEMVLKPRKENDPTALVDMEDASGAEEGSSTSDGDTEAEEDSFGRLREWRAVPIENSPVFIQSDDRFLPVIRRTDRKGDLLKLEPIQFTYLTVDGQEGAVLRCSIQSSQRAPLSQRKSKRAQKLALVIRPPERSTRLFLVSSTKEKTPLEGFEIWSRRPGAPITEKSEFLGKTDWRGSIAIEPSPEGLRLIYVKRGSRALKKLPIMPGLYDSVETNLPNDETRLFAEGVIQGLQNEILSLVIQRQVAEAEIEAALKEKDLDLAREKFSDYEELETPNGVRIRMNDDLVRLKELTGDSRELSFIDRMFGTLTKILTEQELKSKSVELQKQIQDMLEKKNE
ncbi:MAG: hypothetical protein AB8B55_09785 [Mariniblastus sp.]